MALDIRYARSGGVSGPAVRAIALAQVAAVAERVEIPVIGMGGIASGRDAHDFLAAGARCVAIGTENFRDPAAGRRIATELEAISRNERVFSAGDRRGDVVHTTKSLQTPRNGLK